MATFTTQNNETVSDGSFFGGLGSFVGDLVDTAATIGEKWVEGAAIKDQLEITRDINRQNYERDIRNNDSFRPQTPERVANDGFSLSGNNSLFIAGAVVLGSIVALLIAKVIR